jgi:hypothetical protein
VEAELPYGSGLDAAQSGIRTAGLPQIDATIRSGTVNLSGRVSYIQVAGKMSQGSLLPNAADFRPDVKSLGPGSSCAQRQ